MLVDTPSSRWAVKNEGFRKKQDKLVMNLLVGGLEQPWAQLLPAGAAVPCWALSICSPVSAMDLTMDISKVDSGGSISVVVKGVARLLVMSLLLHSRIVTQNDGILVMFETQLSHVWGLLAKRSRDDGEWGGGQEPSGPNGVACAVPGFAGLGWRALMPIMMFCVVGFASALRQVRAHLSAQAWMVVLLLWFSVLQIGEASHPAPDAEFFSFVLGIANPTGFTYESSLWGRLGPWWDSFWLPWFTIWCLLCCGCRPIYVSSCCYSGQWSPAER